jgi:hypothetical protein
MRILSCVILLGAMMACSDASTSPKAPSVAGAWSLDSASPGVPPETMTLSERGTSITGTGSAMGVDVPIPVDITGTFSSPTAVSPPLVSLIFQFVNGGGLSAQFTGTLSATNHISGTVVYYGITPTPQTGTASYTRH